VLRGQKPKSEGKMWVIVRGMLAWVGVELKDVSGRNLEEARGESLRRWGTDLRRSIGCFLDGCSTRGGT
jgi:hypothetical protein